LKPNAEKAVFRSSHFLTAKGARNFHKRKFDALKGHRGNIGGDINFAIFTVKQTSFKLSTLNSQLKKLSTKKGPTRRAGNNPGR
jgi:hypothetical protein